MNSRTSACIGKTAHPSYVKAARSIQGKRRIKNTQPHRKIRVYRCPYCGHWHIGTTPRLRRAKK